MEDRMKELIETAEKLCNGLESVSRQENMFCADISLSLENMAWEMYRTTNALKEIREYVGG